MPNMEIIAHLLEPSDDAPNNARLPLLVYPGAVELTGDDPAAVFEDLFARNGWRGSWRDGVHGFTHWHCHAHEVLGIYSGEVTVQFGGQSGVTLRATPGDVLILPAGTAHRKISQRGRLGVVGAYPTGQSPDLRTAGGPRAADAAAVARVPLPACDPVYGRDGPLVMRWLKE
jgi:uncharacterized protein YjlB